MTLRSSNLARGAFVLAAVMALAAPIFAASNTETVAIDTTGLNAVGADWLKENPYRTNTAQKQLAINIGASGYNQNCARCHGLEAISGGLAPDLRYLDEGKDGDEWFIERTRTGYTQNGITKMPKFEGIISQEAMWALRTYIESRPQD
jgi:cytochrome c-550 PedF